MRRTYNFTRVSKRQRCPICGRPDWCMVRYDDDKALAAICPRTESKHRCGDAGYLHVLEAGSHQKRSGGKQIHLVPMRDYRTLAQRLAEATPLAEYERLSTSLGVTVASLQALRFGYVAGEQLRKFGIRFCGHAWAIPMHDYRGRVPGLRLRLPNGRKVAAKGSRNGLFIPCQPGHSSGPLFIAEGESDTAALLSMGVRAIGRPGALACVEAVVRHVTSQGERDVVVMGDADAVGEAGAAKVAEDLSAMGVNTRVAVPPAKDVRAWFQAGATSCDLRALVASGSGSGGAN